MNSNFVISLRIHVRRRSQLRHNVLRAALKPDESPAIAPSCALVHLKAHNLHHILKCSCERREDRIKVFDSMHDSNASCSGDGPVRKDFRELCCIREHLSDLLRHGKGESDAGVGKPEDFQCLVVISRISWTKQIVDRSEAWDHTWATASRAAVKDAETLQIINFYHLQSLIDWVEPQMNSIRSEIEQDVTFEVDWIKVDHNVSKGHRIIAEYL